MPDREKVINYLESEIKRAEQSVNDIWLECVEVKLLRDALSLLKKQEEREIRICKEICDFIRAGCSTDTDDDKDFVCYEIQKCFWKVK